MKSKANLLAIFVVIGSTYLYSCNQCSDLSDPTRFEISNFEPTNTDKTGTFKENDTVGLSMINFELWLDFKFKEVVNNTPFALFPTAFACKVTELSEILPIKEIHFYSFGNNHTYLKNQKLDSLFFIKGIASQDFNFKNNHLNLPCTIMEKRQISDTLQFRVEIRLENGAVLEQANKPIWLTSY